MYPDKRIQAARRAALSRRLLATQQAHALYGIDPDDVMPLGGWFTSLKRGVSRGASSLISAAKSSGIPVVSTIASSVRSGGEIAESSGLIPQAFRTGSAARGGSSEPEAVAVQAGGLPSWAMPAGLAALVAVLLLRK